MKENIIIPSEHIRATAVKLKGVIMHTPLMRNITVSEEYNCNVFLKREDQQSVRSYKIRIAYNKMISLTDEEAASGVVCASAGNHFQVWPLPANC